jgi:hydroxylaminobenzene mutase
MGLVEPRRRLVWHGVLLFVLGLLVGTMTSAMANPRMGLSAHVGAILNGALLIALGAAWDTVVLRTRGETSAFWMLVTGSYGSFVGLVLAAALGTKLSTPIHGAAHPAAPWAESVVNVVLSVSALAVLVGAIAVLGGLRRGERKGF